MLLLAWGRARGTCADVRFLQVGAAGRQAGRRIVPTYVNNLPTTHTHAYVCMLADAAGFSRVPADPAASVLGGPNPDAHPPRNRAVQHGALGAVQCRPYSCTGSGKWVMRAARSSHGFPPLALPTSMLNSPPTSLTAGRGQDARHPADAHPAFCRRAQPGEGGGAALLLHFARAPAAAHECSSASRLSPPANLPSRRHAPSAVTQLPSAAASPLIIITLGAS